MQTKLQQHNLEFYFIHWPSRPISHISYFEEAIFFLIRRRNLFPFSKKKPISYFEEETYFRKSYFETEIFFLKILFRFFENKKNLFFSTDFFW